jgi:lactoylglutathione lyase
MFREPFPILYSADVDGTADFYRRNFGYAAEYRWPEEGPPEYVALRLGASLLGIATTHGAEQHHGKPIAERGAPVTFELCLSAGDVEAAAKRLVGSGVNQLVAPEVMPWGETRAFFEDPNGYLIQVISLPESE